MLDNKDVIIFGGDSFTFGEGLELYIDSPFWINERNHKNKWMELIHKQSDEAITFRESNRFAGLVSNHFNIPEILINSNGGDIHSPIRLVETFLKENSDKSIKAIIIQFTTLNRLLLHLDTECQCKFCKLTEYANPIEFYSDYLNKLINNESINSLERTALECLRDDYGIPFERIHLDNMIGKLDELFKPIYHENLTKYITKYIDKWSKITPVYFIDSWDKFSSDIINENEYISNNMIPLKGYDNQYYTDWTEWEKTFPYLRIGYEFPATENTHSTLIQNKYIADSIIKAIG